MRGFFWGGVVSLGVFGFCVVKLVGRRWKRGVEIVEADVVSVRMLVVEMVVVVGVLSLLGRCGDVASKFERKLNNEGTWNDGW